MGHFLRPSPVVLPGNALVPDKNVLQPPPNQFTHRLRERTPFYFEAGGEGTPSGYLEKGSRVILMRQGEEQQDCWVGTEQGLYVRTPPGHLDRLDP
jgi:hypothetical protein